jgi:hypothetical protein
MLRSNAIKVQHGGDEVVHQNHFFALDAPMPLLTQQVVLVAAKKHVLCALLEFIDMAGPT